MKKKYLQSKADYNNLLSLIALEEQAKKAKHEVRMAAKNKQR